MPFDAQSTLEKYLNREPLNEELAAVRDGNFDLIERPVEREKATRGGILDEPNRDLTRPERLELRELRQSEGWPVLMRLLQKRFLVLEKAAITMSQSNPLGNSQDIAQKWAYVVLYQQVRTDMELMLELELQKLRAEEQ